MFFSEIVNLLLRLWRKDKAYGALGQSLELVILISPDKLNYVQEIEFGYISSTALIQD